MAAVTAMERRGSRRIMHMSLNRPTRWVIALALTALAVAISYQWLDRPIA